MSCRYACICTGTCYNCHEREPEDYFGQAEDIYDEMYGPPPEQEPEQEEPRGEEGR